MRGWEIVRHPGSKVGSEGRVWGKTYSAWETSFLAGLGPKWLDRIVRNIALLLSESGPKDDCCVWVSPGEELGLFFDFDGSDGVAECLERLAGDLVGPTTPCALPDSAVPALLRRADGTLVRLWEPPGPHLPRRQRVKIEWGEIELFNRYYLIERGEEGLQQVVDGVRAALWRWDPIGVHPEWPECPAKDEYDWYIPDIVAMLKQGAGESELAAHLGTIRTRKMRLPASEARDGDTARDLLVWWQAVR